MIVLLTQAEHELCEELAAKFYNPDEKQERKITNKLSGYEIQLMGLMGEAAVAKVAGVSFDQQYRRKGDGHRGDLEIFGFRCAVKSFSFVGGYLLIKQKDKERLIGKADFIITAYVGDIKTPMIEIAGIVSRQKFEREHFIKNLGYFDNMCLKREDHKPLSEFLKWGITKLRQVEPAASTPPAR